MRKYLIITAMLISFSALAQKKNDTTYKTILELDSAHMTWVFQALAKGIVVWDDQSITMKDGLARRAYINAVINRIGENYQKWFVNKKDKK